MSGFMKQSFIILNLKLVDMMIKAKEKRFEQEKVMMEENGDLQLKMIHFIILI